MASHRIKEVGLVDHQCFFALYEMLSPTGELLHPERLEQEKQLLQARLRQAAQEGCTVYHVFGRSLVQFLTYEGYDVYPADHPIRTSVQCFREALNEALAEAPQLGLRIGFSINQFTFADEVYQKLGDQLRGEGEDRAKVCPGRDFTWQLYCDMLDEFLTAVPGIDIIQLTTNETQVSILECDCPLCADLDMVQRIQLLTNTTQDVCEQHGVELQLRSWGEMEDEGGFDRISDDLHPDVAVSVKNTAGDFHLFLPPHPMIGYGDRSQIVEFDAWREFSGWNTFPCYMGEIYRERLRLVQRQGVDRVTLRITWLPPSRKIESVPWGNTLNRQAFFALVEDLDADLDHLLRESLALYAPSLPEDLLNLYRESATIYQASYFPDDMILHCHSTIRAPWEDGQYAVATIRNWTRPARNISNPKPERLAEIARENRQRWQGVVKRVEALQGELLPEFYQDLHENALGHRYLQEIIPRLFELAIYANAEKKPTLEEVQARVAALRDLATNWQQAAPHHFTDMMGEFTYQAAREYERWLNPAHQTLELNDQAELARPTTA